MRIATSQLHHQALQSMQRQTAKIQKTELQIASGLKFLKPSDDPVGAVKVLNLNTNLGMVEQYSRNVAQAQTALAFQESVLVSVNDALQRIRELTVQANNPANHDSALRSIGQEIDENLKHLKVLANTRDSAGEYIFGGFRVDQPPFVEDGGNMIYNGDQGQRFVRIGEGAQVAVRDPGDDIFMNIRGGDGRVQVLASDTNAGSMVVGQFGVVGNYAGGTYSVTFSAGAPGQPMQYTATDDAVPPNVVASGNYTNGGTLNVGGAQFTLTGTPNAGDTLTVQAAQHVDLFKIVSDIASALQAGSTGAGASARRQNAVAQGLANLDQALDGISNQRASVGNRLGHIETIDDLNQDF
ncbi:MAG: flagellar hook-associated protein FlgL, partial [Pseudomonadota bacterium]|nr:flagellar hook-associated protein FlgL [Pseudomonadota bacterium]